MKHPDDTRTLELPGLTVATKRGRGRPRKDDALTPAERAQRYRDRKKAAKRVSAVRYRGPNGEGWTGRGQVPAWLRARINHFGETKEMYDTQPEFPTLMQLALACGQKKRLEAAQAAGHELLFKYFCDDCGWNCTFACKQRYLVRQLDGLA